MDRDRIEMDVALAGVRGDAHTARRAVLDLFDSESPAVLIDDAVLLASELVTNMVQHTTGGGRLRGDYGSGLLRVEVSDNSTTIPTVSRCEPAAIGGHGLRLVDAIAHRWGIEPSETGKTIWFELVAAPT